MATDALVRPSVRRERPKDPTWDRIFFSAMAVILWGSVLFGFAKTYFLAGMVRAPLPSVLVHIHGAAFTLWMVLLVVQIGLISTKHLKWHKQLGLAGFGLSVAMVVLGLLAATAAMRRGSAPQGLDAKVFYAVPMTGIVTFAVMIYLAYRMRFQPAAHKRMILIATIGITDAAVGRWPVAILQARPQLQNLVMLGFLLLVVGYDLVSLHRVHKVTIWASIVLMIVLVGGIPFGMTPLWQSFANFMTVHP
jgi:hypothetical protein